MFIMVSTSMTPQPKTNLTSSFDIDFSTLNLVPNPLLEHRFKILTISNISLKQGIKKTIPTNLINSKNIFQITFNFN